MGVTECVADHLSLPNFSIKPGIGQFIGKLSRLIDQFARVIEGKRVIGIILLPFNLAIYQYTRKLAVIVVLRRFKVDHQCAQPLVIHKYRYDPKIILVTKSIIQPIEGLQFRHLNRAGLH
ncbi:hypothetical protein D3C86_796270 [compost metagenome]